MPTSKSTDGRHKIRQTPSIPVFVHKEVLSRRDSFDSSTMSNIGPGDVNVLGFPVHVEEKSLGFLAEEKASDLDPSQFVPTLSYGEITLNDVGGLLSVPSSASASGPPSSFSSSPFLTRENSLSNNPAAGAR